MGWDNFIASTINTSNNAWKLRANLVTLPEAYKEGRWLSPTFQCIFVPFIAHLYYTIHYRNMLALTIH